MVIGPVSKQGSYHKLGKCDDTTHGAQQRGYTLQDCLFRDIRSITGLCQKA